MAASVRLWYLALSALVAVACAGAAPAPAPEPSAEAAPAAPLQPAGPALPEAPLVPAAPTGPAPAPPTPRVQADRPPLPTPTPSLPTWVQSVRPTALQAGPTDDAVRFNLLPPLSYLKVLEARPGWLLVVYGGDGDTLQPGTAWVRAADVAPPDAPPRWVKNHAPTPLWSGSDGAALRYTLLPPWSLLELTEQQRNGRLLVRYPGDGRYRLPGLAWVEQADVGPVQPPRPWELPRAYPALLHPDTLRLLVPYRSQLDGSPWEDANCGPTTLGMALEALGTPLSSAQLRREVLDAQQLWGDDVGVYMEALARVAEAHGARVLDLHQADGLKRWTLDDVRRHVRQGHPVILQVVYRALPGRERSPYYGDHYIVITGLLGDQFLYHDSVDSDGLGHDRVISPERLARAMNASDRTYAYAGFALTRR